MTKFITQPPIKLLMNSTAKLSRKLPTKPSKSTTKLLPEAATPKLPDGAAAEVAAGVQTEVDDKVHNTAAEEAAEDVHLGAADEDDKMRSTTMLPKKLSH